MRGRSPAVFFALILGFCSFAYEIILVRAISEVLNQVALIQSLGIGFYILGLGMGAFRQKTAANPLLSLCRVELILPFLSILAIMAIFLSDLLGFILGMKANWGLTNTYFVGLIGFFSIFCVGYFSGKEIPLLCLMTDAPSDKQVNYEHLILGAHYFGSFMAAIIIPLWSIVSMGLFQSLSLVVVFNAFLACLLVFSSSRMALYLGLVSVCIGISLWQVNHQRFQEFYLKVKFTSPILFGQGVSSFERLNRFLKVASKREVERHRSVYQVADIYRQPIKNQAPFVSLLLNGQIQFDTRTSNTYHKFLGEIPLFLHDNEVRSVLILGGGDGILAHHLEKYNLIERIDLVELDETIIQLATDHPDLQKFNGRVFQKSKKLNVIVTDAIQFLRESDRQYDAIYIDFPYPIDHDLLKLYSVEFYKLVKFRLHPNGFVALDAPVGLSYESNRKPIFSSLYFGGFESIYFYGFLEGYLLAFPGRREIKKDPLQYETLNKEELNLLKDGLKKVDSQMLKPEDSNRILHPRWPLKS